VAVRTACLLLPVRESKSINNVGTSFAINRINERTIDVLARKRQTITNTITRPSGSAVGAGPSPAACGPPARCETGRRRVKRRAGRPLWAYSDQCGLVSRLHASHIRLQYPLITQTHTCRARGLMSVLTDRPRPRRTAMADVWPSSAAQNHSALKINNRAPLIARPPPPRPSHRALCRDQCD
jgi:hypothetical protein